MTSRPDQQRAIDTAIVANLDVLALMLEASARSAAEAREAISGGRRNLAIGTIRPLQEALPECDALLKSTMALARFQTTEEGSLL